jgi:hypothetical protein
MILRFLINIICCLVLATQAHAIDQPLDLGAHENALSPKVSQNDVLSPAAKQLAEQLGILGNIEKLHEWRNKPAASVSDSQFLQNKQVILQNIILAMLEVRATSAQIAYDIFEAGQLQNFMQDRRDKQIKANSIANFVSGGVSEILGGSFQISPKIGIDRTGNILEVVGGAMQTGLSTIALRQAGGEKKRVTQGDNMLAPLFDPINQANNKYPIDVWRYVNSNPPGEKETRRTLLVKEWIRFARLKTIKDKDFIAALTGGGAKNTRLTIDLLEDRQAMLSDLDTLVSQMDKHLLEIMIFCR